MTAFGKPVAALLLVPLLLLFLAAPPLAGQNIFTIAGIPPHHRSEVDGQPALGAALGRVYGLLIDKTTGQLLLHDEYLVARLEPDGTLSVEAGTGPLFSRAPLFGSDLASALNFRVLRSMAQDANGALYLSDAGAGLVYRIARNGTARIFAGGGTRRQGAESDGGPATEAILPSPRGLAFDSKGNLNIAEVLCRCIRRVAPDGTISTFYTLPVPPSGSPPPDIEGLAIDAQDNLYFTEWRGHVLVKLPADGSAAVTIAGTGTPGFSGDGGPAAAAQLNGPTSIALDAEGNLYLADTNNHRVRKIAAGDGAISTFAGVGTCGFSGDGGAALEAQLCQPAQVTLDSAGNLLIADFLNRRVRKVTPDGAISTIAGSGDRPRFLSISAGGDGGPAIQATFGFISGIAFDPAGNLYISDRFAHVIRKITPEGVVSTVAGTGRSGYSGDGGPALEANLAGPGPLLAGPDGALYVITMDSRIRKITPDGTIALVAGTDAGLGPDRALGDGGPAVNAALRVPEGIAFDQQGNLYIADTVNARIRKVDRSGIITTVAGPGQPGVDLYNAVAVDARGSLYLASTRAATSAVSAAVSRVNLADGSLTRIAGSGRPCPPIARFTARVPAMQADLCTMRGLAIDRNGLLNLVEGGAQLLRLAADGNIERVAGDLDAVVLGDGGPALQAGLLDWGGGFIAAFDPSGNLHIAQPGPNLIRQVTTTPYALRASPGRIGAPGKTVISVSANFAEPFPYAVTVKAADGGAWLGASRVTGLAGESVTVNVNPAGLAPGTYRGTVSLSVSIPAADTGIRQVDIPVEITVP